MKANIKDFVSSAGRLQKFYWVEYMENEKIDTSIYYYFG